MGDGFSGARPGWILSVLALLVALMMLAPPATTNVYLDADPRHVIAVRSTELGRPVDVAYDAARKYLYILAILPHGDHVTKWSASGRLIADWRLPPGYDSASALVLYHGSVALHWWDTGRRKNADIIFPVTGERNYVLGDMGDYHATNSKTANTVRRVRTIMTELGVVPNADDRADAFSADGLIASFMPTNPYRYERIAWTKDYSVVGYCWENGQSFHLAVKNKAGGYEDRDLYKRLMSALGWKPIPSEPVYLYSINVSGVSAAFGMQMENTKRSACVVWLDLRSNAWDVSKAAPGLLARELIEIGD